MNTIQYINEQKFNGITDIKQLRSKFYNKKITVSYEPLKDNQNDESEEKYRRVIFSCSKTIKSLRNLTDLQLDCNGLILGTDGNKWEILVLPILTPKINVNTTKVNKFLKKKLYDIYKVQDGTVINLYHFNEEWVISTSRGFNMNTQKFNNLSFTEILEDVLSSLSMNYQNFLNSLNKNYCYTFIVKHPDMHPFSEGVDEEIYKLIAVQSVQVKDETAENYLKINYNPSIEVELDDSSEDEKVALIPTQEKIDFRVNKIHELFVNKENTYKNFIDNKIVNFGYLMVSKEYSITTDHSQIILESDLMRYIRNLWYNGHDNKFIKQRGYKRNRLILLNSYLDDNRTEIFLNLFPQYANTFESLDNQMIQLAEKIKNQLIINKEIEIEETLDAKVINYFYKEISNNINYFENDEMESVIKQYIRTPKFIDLYYAYLTI